MSDYKDNMNLFILFKQFYQNFILSFIDFVSRFFYSFFISFKLFI